MKPLRTIKQLIISIICLIIIAGVFLVLAGCDLFSSSKAKEQEIAIGHTKADITFILREADDHISLLVTIEERQDEHGRPYLVGVISDKLDVDLEDLVAAYNADPSTTKPITVDEVRYSLTAGIVEACADDNRDSAFCDFLYWTGKDVDLVYNGHVTDSNGTEHFEGDPADTKGRDSKGITNYMFVVGREGLYENYKFAWE